MIVRPSLGGTPPLSFHFPDTDITNVAGPEAFPWLPALSWWSRRGIIRADRSGEQIVLIPSDISKPRVHPQGRMIAAVEGATCYLFQLVSMPESET